jgi:hypothetical protein
MMLVLFLVLGAATAIAGEDFTVWKYQGNVQAPTGRFVALPLSPQNLDLSDKADLTDFRITDAQGTELPHAVVFETELRTETEQSGRELNREYPDPSTIRLTLDFGGTITKNRILVQTEGSSFRRHVQVEGSNDSRSWSMLLPEGWLIAAGNDREERFESADTGINTYRYIRVSVSAMPDERTAPRIVRVTCRHEVIKKAQETEIGGRLLAYRAEKSTSVAELDFGRRNLPVQRLRLLLARDPERIFEKPCAVYGRNTLQHIQQIRFETDERGADRLVDTPWKFLGSSTVFRDPDGRASLEIPVRSNLRYIRINIENGNSPALEVKGVAGFMVPAYLVFEPAGQSRFMLYAGNPDAESSRYESAKVLASLDTRTLPKCSVADLAPQPGARPKAAPAGRQLVWVVLAAVVAATLWILWRTARGLGETE